MDGRIIKKEKKMQYIFIYIYIYIYTYALLYFIESSIILVVLDKCMQCT